MKLKKPITSILLVLLMLLIFVPSVALAANIAAMEGTANDIEENIEPASLSSNEGSTDQCRILIWSNWEPPGSETSTTGLKYGAARLRDSILTTDALADYANLSSGAVTVTIEWNTDIATQDLSSNYDLIIVYFASNYTFKETHAAALKTFLESGGRVIFQQEWCEYKKDSNTQAANAGTMLGVNFSIHGSYYGAGNLTVATVPTDSDIYNSGKRSGQALDGTLYWHKESPISYNSSGQTVGKTGSHNVIVDLKTGKGRVTVMSDENWWYGIAEKTDASSYVYVYKDGQLTAAQDLWGRIIANTVENKKIVAAGGDPNGTMYTVKLTASDGVTTSGGAATQRVSAGSSISPLTLTAGEDSYFSTETITAFNAKNNGLAITPATDASEITISGIPNKSITETVSATAKAAQDAPDVEGVIGTISGTTAAMEYRAGDSGDWTPCTDGATIVEPGEYQVRYAATASKLASPATAVTVPNISFTGKLLDKTGGSEMTDSGKTYDKNAVVCTELSVVGSDGAIEGVTYTYEWQKKSDDGSYNTVTGLTDAAGPSDVGKYKLTVKACKDGSELATKSWSFTISPVTLTVNVTAKNKEYDGNTTAELDGDPTLTGVLDGDTVILSGTASACFANANIENDKTVTVTGLTLSGSAAANYELPGSITCKASITKATGSGTVTINGWIYGDAANAPVPTSTTNGTKHVSYLYKVKGAADTTYAAAAPTKAGTYTVKAIFAETEYYKEVVVTRDFTIEQKTLTATAAAQDKVYDGGTAVPYISATVPEADKVGSDDVSVKVTSASFADKNVNTGKTVTATVELEGADKANYKLASGTVKTTAAITAKSVTITGVTVEATKVYDGNNSVKITNNGTVNGKVDSDKVTIVPGKATYDNKNVGTTKTVTFTGFKLDGEDAGNYTLTAQPTGTTAAITPKELSVDVTADNKTYDKSDAATVRVSLSGVLTDDNVTLNTDGMSAKFDSADAGNTKNITVTGLTLNNNGYGNYVLPSRITGVADIEKATPAASDCKVTIAGWIYGGTANAPVPVSDTNGTTGVTYKYTDQNGVEVGQPTKAGKYTVTATFPENTNYKTATATAEFTISPKTLSVTIKAQNKTYDGKTDAVVTAELNGVVGSDSVIATASNAAFENKNIGTKTVTANITISGEDAANYTVNSTAETVAKIIVKELTIKNLAVADKTYDGLAAATISGTPTLSGVVSDEQVTLINGIPTFSTVMAGNDIAINFTDFSISGTDIGNYTLIQPTGVKADINAYNATGAEYTTTTREWTNQNFVVTAADGWQVSATNTADGEWSKNLTRSDETGNGRLPFYLKNTTSGIISEVVTETYKIDKTAPTGMISIDERNAWQTFVNTLTFDLFYKDEQTVTLTAADGGSGVSAIEYFVSEEDLVIEDLSDEMFTEYARAFGIEPDAKLIVYARLTDTAGNVTYIRSDGVVLDGTTPVINGADDGKTYCAAVTLTITDEHLDSVTLNGEAVNLTDGKLTLNPAEGEQTVIATDKAGNSTSITVTVNDGHTWSDWASNGDNTHTRTCHFDAEHTETENCHGGTATCRDKAVCDDCNAPHGELDPKNHADLKHIEAKEATTASEGNIEYWYCGSCDKYYADADTAKEIARADTVLAKIKSNANAPKTGDQSNIALWIVLLIISGTGAAGTAVYSKRKRRVK